MKRKEERKEVLCLEGSSLNLASYGGKKANIYVRDFTAPCHRCGESLRHRSGVFKVVKYPVTDKSFTVVRLAGHESEHRCLWKLGHKKDLSSELGRSRGLGKKDEGMRSPLPDEQKGIRL